MSAQQLIPSPVPAPESAQIRELVADGEIVRLDALRQALSRAGTLQISGDEAELLMEPFPREVERVIPGRGLRYIPHIEISRRLNRVLGIGQWAIVRLREWVDPKSKIAYASYAMIVRGVWVGDSVVGGGIPGGNASIDWGDAVEGTRGVALRRIAAKALGCGDQVWEKAPDPTPAPSASPTSNGKHTGKGNGRPVHATRLDDGVIIQLESQLRETAETQGTTALAKAWADMTKDQRIALAGKRQMYKDIAAKTDQRKLEDEQFGRQMDGG